MKSIAYPLIIFTLTLLIACGGGDDPGTSEPEVINPPTSVKVKDVANFQNALDLQVTFSKPSNQDLIESFGVFIVPESASSSFDSLAAIANNNFLKIGKNESTTGIIFPEGQVDSEGNSITEGISYLVFVVSLGTTESEFGGALSEPSSPITLTQNNVVRTLTAINGGTGGMDVDADGNIYMADFGQTTSGPAGTKVFKISQDGSVSTFASGFHAASGNDFDAEGNLIQSNIFGGTLSKVSPDGNVTNFASGLSGPVGVVVASNGDMFVCNCSNNSISKVTSDGTVSTFASSSLMNCPNGIDIDNAGNLYVANFNSSNLVKITPSGSITVLATMPGNNNGHLLINGNFIYVISRGLHQIHRVSFSGSVSLFAGSGQRGIVDGPLTEASFSLPNDLAFSPDGKLIYINDVNGSNTDPTVISPSIIRVIELVE